MTATLDCQLFLGFANNHMLTIIMYIDICLNFPLMPKGSIDVNTTLYAGLSGNVVFPS
jgi:hypothetical protein